MTIQTNLLFTTASVNTLFITRYSEYAWRCYLTQIDVLGRHEIREILLHVLFQTNINVQNALHMKKRLQGKPRRAF